MNANKSDTRRKRDAQFHAIKSESISPAFGYLFGRLQAAEEFGNAEATKTLDALAKFIEGIQR